MSDPREAVAQTRGVRVAFERWVEQDNREQLRQLVRTSLEELKAATAA